MWTKLFRIVAEICCATCNHDLGDSITVQMEQRNRHGTPKQLRIALSAAHHPVTTSIEQGWWTTDIAAAFVGASHILHLANAVFHEGGRRMRQHSWYEESGGLRRPAHQGSLAGDRAARSWFFRGIER